VVSALLLVMAVLAHGVAGTPTAVAATPVVKVYPTSGTVGFPVKVAFSGFPKNATLTVTWDGKSLATTKTSVAGDGSVAIHVPIGKKGSHKVKATVGSTSATTTFTIVPKLTLTPTNSAVGRTLSVTLRGYAANEAIALKWDSSTAKTLLTVTASSSGSASANVVVPHTTFGQHKLVGRGTTGSLSSARLQIASTIRLRPASGPAGTNLQVVLRGFAANEYIEVQWRDANGTRSLGFGTASGLGSLDKTVKVPTSAAPGNYTILAVGYSGSAVQAPYQVT